MTESRDSIEGKIAPAETGQPSETPSATVQSVPQTDIPPTDIPEAATPATKVPADLPRTAVPDILNDPIVKHMRPVAPLLRGDMTIQESLDLIRSTRDIGRVVYFYVIDADRKLTGVVPTRRLLLDRPETRITEVMVRSPLTVSSSSTVIEACEMFTKHKLLAFPVVDAEGVVLGAIDVDLYTDEVQAIDRRQDSEDLFQLIGVHLTDAAKGSPGAAFLGRFPWLLCNVGGGMLSAFIADAYADVSTLALVAPFIALVTAMAESVSIQSVGLAIQALHTHPISWKTFGRQIRQELLVGLLLGLGCGLSVGLVAWLWKGDVYVALSLLLGIAGGVTASAGVGLSMPFVLRMISKDPQVASGPIALALSDVVVLLCYFNLGRLLLSH